MVSLALATLSLAMCIVYSGPEFLIRRPSPAGQTSIVQYIESLGPYWPAVFGISGISLLVTALTTRGVIYGHAFCAASWTGYGVALLVGPLLTVPPAPIVVGVMAVMIVPIHLTCIVAWKERGFE